MLLKRPSEKLSQILALVIETLILSLCHCARFAILTILTKINQFLLANLIISRIMLTGVFRAFDNRSFYKSFDITFMGI